MCVHCTGPCDAVIINRKNTPSNRTSSGTIVLPAMPSSSSYILKLKTNVLVSNLVVSLIYMRKRNLLPLTLTPMGLGPIEQRLFESHLLKKLFCVTCPISIQLSSNPLRLVYNIKNPHIWLVMPAICFQSQNQCNYQRTHVMPCHIRPYLEGGRRDSYEDRGFPIYVIYLQRWVVRK